MTAPAVPRTGNTPFLRLLRDDRSGMAVVEFALCLPFFVAFTMGGVELTNFTTTKMRMSQIALQVADNASRIGTGSVVSSKQISEAQINDLLTGAGLQADALDLYGRGRVILYSLEPVANPNTTDRYTIRWKRCRGAKTTYAGSYTQGQTNLTGFVYTPPVGTTQTIKAPNGGAVMVVQLSYTYRPLITQAFALKSEILEFGAMTVRDPRDMTGPSGGVGIYNTEGVTVSTC
ncbi:TadE/TadG family type IV pilus assembly protein [Sphingobium algorifonticola]|uniref:Pilus assembly protein n=1 Tax=Sphingobium algorifonticola TaxID=2008318 RepID=A0A437JBW4_9SPHN|nr:TadE family protein [Sphingobium algorifonticola]RVT43122.1 pilus assembly protein [Sphingobium algorifonticola]